MVSELPTKSVLEPLCKATEQHFKAPPLFPNDYLHVGLDEDMKRFVVHAQGYRPYKGVIPIGCTEKDIVNINGTLMLKDGHGPSNAAAEHWLKMVPERKDLGFGKWRLAGTDFTALSIHHTWPLNKLVFDNDAARVLYATILGRFQSQHINSIRAAKFDIEGILPELPEDFIDHPEFPLLKHQFVPLVNSLHQQGYALFMEQGTCKTSTTIARICLEAARKRAGRIPGWPQTMYRVLIVCPNAVRHNWANEFSKFAVVPGKVTIIDGEWETRVRRQLDGTTDDPECAWSACMIGYDSVEPTIDSLIRSPWDLVVCDESHWVKNHRTNRWQALRDLRKNGKTRQWMILTGTPIANTVMDLWAQLELLGDGTSGFLTYKNFTAFHGKYVHLEGGNMGTGSAVEKLVGIKHIPLIQERLSRVSYRITKARAGLNLPDKVYDVVDVEMTELQSKYYNIIKDELAVEIKGIMEDETRRIRADHILTKLLRLAQITSGHMVLDEERDLEGNLVAEQVSRDIPGKNPKMEALVGLLTDEGRDPRGKTIVWACFKHDIRSIRARMEAEGIGAVEYFGETTSTDRDEAVRKFNCDPSIKVFIANPQTAGAGLNLLGYDPAQPDLYDTYCDHEVFFSQNWSSVLRSQAEDRAHRKGTRTNVRITDLTVPDTVDEDIRKEVTKKQQDAEAIQDIKDILRNVLGIV